MAAEIIAGALELDLYRIDLASTVSKYIGETEKNLRRIFDAAEESSAILLFDEADALFGKRSDVRDSHDRYANLEISYLLQRIESFRGVAILTTNMPQAIDAAFLRRIRFIVPFPFPDAESRMRIWQSVFPSATPLGAIQFERLAQLNASGGAIRNIATHAAFIAAEDRQPVSMNHLFAAARIEYSKDGQAPHRGRDARLVVRHKPILGPAKPASARSTGALHFDIGRITLPGILLPRTAPLSKFSGIESRSTGAQRQCLWPHRKGTHTEAF